MRSGITETKSGEFLVLSSKKWDLPNETNSVKDNTQLMSMSLIYNHNVDADKLTNNDVQFIHHFADSGHVSREAILKIKDEIELIFNEKAENIITFLNQSKSGYIRQLAQGLPHINKHLKDIGVEPIVLNEKIFVKANPDIIVSSSYKGLVINVNDKIANRMTFEYVAHVIHGDETGSNKNGINWQEEYVLKNLNSAKSMPIKYEPDFDGVPMGHGYFTEDIDGNVISLWSEIAGFVTDVRIDNIPNTDKRGLICTAYIDTVVHSDLAQWIRGRFNEGKNIDTSVEICGKKDENDNQQNITYKSNGGSPKIPIDYDYIGSAILGVEPADNYATIVEVNSKGELVVITKKEEENKLNIEELKVEVSKLEQDKVDLDKVISEKDVTIDERDTTITELNTDNETITKERDVLQSYKDEKEKEIIVNAFNAKMKEEHSEKVLETFAKEMEEFGKSPLEYDTKTLEINMLKETLKVAKEEKIKANSKEDDLFVANSKTVVDDEDVYEL